MQVASYTTGPDHLGDALELLGDRWTLPLLVALLPGPRRFKELHEQVPGIASNVLSARLRTLEREGLIAAERYCARPPRFEYRLTPDGEAASEAARTLSSWAAGRAGAAAGPIHDACGGPLELRWWCPACGRLEGAEDDAILA